MISTWNKLETVGCALIAASVLGLLAVVRHLIGSTHYL
jgi:hypothetical protein